MHLSIYSPFLVIAFCLFPFSTSANLRHSHRRKLLRPVFVSAACGENKPRVIVPRVIVPRVTVPRVIVVEEKFKEHNLLSS